MGSVKEAGGGGRGPTEAKLNELKELAGRATPGPWYVAEPLDGLLLIRSVAMEKKLYSRRPLLRAANTANTESAEADLRYAAAASPDVALALIERIEWLEKEADWLANMLTRSCSDISGCPVAGTSTDCPGDNACMEVEDCQWRAAARRAVEEQCN